MINDQRQADHPPVDTLSAPVNMDFSVALSIHIEKKTWTCPRGSGGKRKKEFTGWKKSCGIRAVLSCRGVVGGGGQHLRKATVTGKCMTCPSLLSSDNSDKSCCSCMGVVPWVDIYLKRAFCKKCLEKLRKRGSKTQKSKREIAASKVAPEVETSENPPAAARVAEPKQQGV